MEKLEPIIRRVFFYGAFVLGIIAAIEKVVNLLGTSFLKPLYEAHDLLEFAAIALIFSIAMQLHQIRLLLSSKSNEPPK